MISNMFRSSGGNIFYFLDSLNTYGAKRQSSVQPIISASGTLGVFKQKADK